MATRSSRVTRWFVASFVGFIGLLAALAAPETGRADTDLPIGGNAVIADAQGDPVNLRDAPWGNVITRYPEGTWVAVLDGPFQAGDGSHWSYIEVDGAHGYMTAEYLSAGGTSGGTAVLDELNLRAGPSTSDDVITVMSAGATVELTGLAANGFVSVLFDGMDGWAYADYLGDGFSAAASGEILYTNDWLNLRSGPSTADGVLTVMAPGTTVEVIGGPDNGFFQVVFNGQRGWAYADFLGADASSSHAASGGSSIIWPVSGGEWEISQGYFGPSSHYNASSTYQYAYALDLARTDGASAWQPVYSQVNGSIRWTEAASGGISIDMGNGYAAAMFHLTLDPSLSWGQSVSQGQYLGTISGPGGNGYMGFAHVHVSLWATDDGGNWSRNAVPFTGANAISGYDLPDTGAGNQHAGTVFYP